MLPYRCLRDARGCLRKLAVFLALAFIVLAQLLFCGTASADPYPPTWGPIGTAPTSAVHFSVVPWPNEPANPANCGESCGDWLPYRYFGSTVNDPRIQDPSNGGTAPQNYVNISSSCVDQAKPSVYYYLDKVHNTLLFRWRVEQIANNYATGPNPSTQITDNPWNSALWTVFFDLNGDGYRDFAAHLNGSSGDPSSQVDRLQGIWGNVPSNQSLDYINDPNIHLLKHNPTGFVDSGTGRLLNFNNSLAPSALWPNGASERTWDYGTSRSRIVSQANVDGATCNEYFVDYQIPMGLLDASNYPDAPKIDDNTPLSMLFCTANSLNNPFQKDCAYNGAWVADPSQPAPFGDYLTLGGGLIYQPIVDKVQANGCGPVNLATTVKDTLYTAGNVAATSVKGVNFYYYTDTNGNGLADDDGSTWTLATSATASALNTWQATWNNIPNLNGSYLIGVQAIDDGSRVSGGTVSRTFSYLTPAEVEQIAGQAPQGENWAANPAVTGAQSTALYLNTCGVPQPYISKAAGAATVSAGSSVAFTLTVHNTLSTALAVNSIQDALPPGFTFVSFDSLSLGSPSAIPSVGASGTITWAFSTPASVPPGSTLRLVFHARAPSIAGTYSNVATAATGSGTLVSDPVQVSVGTPRLTIAKAANTETLKPGDAVTYTITYANNSPVNVTGAVITDVVPAGLSNITPLDGGVYVSSSRTLTWTIGAIASGAGPYTVRFTARVNSPYGGANPLVNIASIDAIETDPASASSSTFISYPAPQLVLQKSASPTVIDTGTDVTFTLRYQNVGSTDATGVVITDTIPIGFTFVSASSGGVNSNGTVQWTIGTLGPWVSNTVDLVLRADSTYTATNPQTNTAWIRSVETSAVSASAKVGINTTGQSCTTYYFQKDTIAISSILDLRATQTKPVSTTVGWSGTRVTAPDKTSVFSETLRFYQDPGATTDIAIAGNITTTFYVDRNPGSGVDLRATVYDYNPDTGYRTSLGSYIQAYGGSSVEPMTFAVPSAGTLRKGHRLLWVVDVRAANNPVDIAIQYGGTVTNTLSAPATTSYAESRSTLCVTPPANLSLQKQVNKQQVTLGDTVVYTLTFANSGSTGVTNAKITDTLPSGLTYQGAALNGAAVTPAYNSGQTVVFVVNSPLKSSGVITATAGGTLVITGVVASSLPMATTSLLNQATLESDQTLPVTASAASSVVQPDLSVAKHASQGLLAPGDTVTYTVAVQNTGTYTATNVIISDTLPATAYYTYVAGSTRVNNGVAADSVTGSLLSVNVGSVGPGATATVAFSMRVASSGVPDGVTVLSNTAAVTSTQTAAKTSQAVDVFISTNPNLAISKKIEPAGSLAPGDLVTYTMVVTNTGRGDALNVEVLDPLPDNTAYVFGSLALDGSARTDVQDTDNGRFEAANNRVRFTIGTLTQGQAHTMVFHARVMAPLPNGVLPVDNLAYASASNTATKDAFVSSLATAAPSLALDKQGPSVVAYPAAKVVTTGAATTMVEVDSATQLIVGQYVSINGQQRKITAIDGHKITVASSLSVAAGQAVVGSFTYDIAYRNTGDAAASSAAVVDTLPAGLTLIETSPTAQVTGSRLAWDIGTLDPDEMGVLRVVVLPTASGVLTNSAVLDSSETEPITDTVVTTAGGLIVGKRTTTPSVEQTPSGTAATYVVEIQNTLATATNGVIVTDTLPSGFVYQATVGTPTGGTRSPSTPSPAVGSAQPSWGTFSIPANSTLAITFTASVSAETGAATYQNALFATATNAAVTQFDELSTPAEDVTVLLPQVILAKTVTPSEVTAGDTVTYTITAQNVGGAPARTLQISDVLPSGFSYAGPTVMSTLAATRTATVNPTLGDVRPAWGAWDIAAGGTLTLTFAVDTAHIAGTYYNDVNAAGANVVVPPIDDTAPVTLTAAVADLRLAKIVTPATQYVGQNVVFTLTLANDGPNAATNVTVSDTLPSGFTYVSSSAAVGTYNATSGLWTVGELNPAGSSTLVITATVNAAGSYTNYAQVASSEEVDGDSTPGNNSSTEDDDDSVTIGVVPVADLRLAKAGTPTSQYVGQNVVFTLTLTNDGPSAASGVTVNDLLPSGFTYSASRAAQGTYNNTTGLWTVGNLGKNAVTTLVITATVNAAGSYTNYAQVASSDQYDGDSTPGNSSSTEDDDDAVTITVIPVADLRLAKIGTPATQYVGQNVVFTLTLTNDGPNAADSVTVNDLLPSGFTYSASSATQGTYNNTTGLWTVGSLSKDAGATLVITATVNASGSYINRSEVAHSDQHDGDSTPGNNSSTEDDDDSVTITAVPVADLRLAKTGTPPTQYVGETVVFTLTLTNDGPSAASSVTVNDLLPNGFTYSASTAGQGTYNGTTGLWTIGSLGKDASTTLVVTATVNAGGDTTNKAEVAHSDQYDGDSTPANSSTSEDDDDSVTITAVPVADLRLAKAGSPGAQHVGQDVVFTLTLTNDGPSAASGVTVSDTLPSGFTYSASSAAQGTYDDTTGLWTVGSLDKDAKATLVITATVNAGGNYTNYAQVANSDQHDGDSTPGNNSSTEDDDDSVTITAMPVADLRLAKIGTPTIQYVGQNVVFTLTLTNDGPSAASGVTVHDLLPSGYSYEDSLPANGTYSNSTGLWTVGNLAKDNSTTLVVTATVNAGGDYTNRAEVAHSDQHDGDSTPGNSSITEDDDDSAAITAVPVANLRLAKIGTPSSQYVGQNVVFTLTLTNDGPSAASGVTVRDLLPNGFAYSASTTAQGTYSETTGLWTVGSLGKDAGATLVVTVTVNAGGSYTNYAQVASSDQYDGDSTPGNDSINEDDDDAVTITAVPVADLRLAKIGSPSNQRVGQNVVFTLTLTNDGPNSASGVTVSDLLPSGFSYVASLPSTGTYNDTTGLWTVGSLDKDAGANLVMTATVNASGSYTNYAEVAHSDQHDGDSTPGNSSLAEDDDDSVTIVAVPVADLRLAKAGAPTTQYVGQNVVFTLTVTNDGPCAAGGVTVSDLLPSGFTYVDSSAAAGTYTGNTGLWTVGGLAKDASTTLVITTTVNAGGDYVNKAEVAHSDQYDGDSTPGNNSTTEDDDDSLTVTAVPVADLRLAKVGNPATQYVGQNVVFTLTVTNDGPSAAGGVTVKDLLPSGFTYSASATAVGSYDKDTGLWTVGSLNKDTGATLVVTATVNAGGDYDNYTQVWHSDQYDGDSTPGNNSTDEDDDAEYGVTAVPVADLRLAKIGTPTTQYVGQSVVFTLTLANDGPNTATNVTVSDTLPRGFTYVDSSAAVGTYNDTSGLWSVGSLDKDASATLVITATVNAAGDYTNYAELAGSDQHDGDSTPGNKSTDEDDDDSVTITAVPVADLRLAKTGTPATQYVGQTVVFTVTLTNDGPSPASGVTVNDLLPSGFSYADSAAATGSYSDTTGLWTVGSLDKDASMTLVITATVNAAGSYTNRAEIAHSDQYDGDSTPANSSSTEDDDDTFAVTPIAVADLRLAKVGTPAVQYVGQDVVFTLTVTNDGPSAAGGVTVNDLLPEGFTYVGSVTAAGSYSDTTGSWTVGSLSKDASASLVITASVNVGGDYTNYAEVAHSDQYDGDSTAGNSSSTEDDDDSVSITAAPVADLHLAKAGSPATQYVGQNVVFTLTLKNAGPSAASSVTVSDTLPDGFTYIDSLAAAGSYDQETGLWSVGSLSKDAATTLVITATVNAGGSYTNYAQVAHSDQYDGDSTPADNSTTEDDDDSVTIAAVPVADLRLAKIGTPATQYVGENVVFTLTLTNDGPSAASGVTVTDLLPSGFSYVDSLPADGTYDKDTGAWTVANLDKDEDTNLVITATVNTLGSYTNYAEVKSSDQYDGDSTAGNRSSTEDDDDSATITAVPVADLRLAKIGSPAAQDVGQNVVFTLTLTNDGPSAASSVTVTDLLPSGFTYVDSLPSTGSYAANTGLWTVGSLSKNAGANLVITATVNSTGEYTNTAEAAHSDQYDGDSTAGNSSATEDDDDSFTVTAVPVIDLQLVETGNPATQYVGQTVVFTLTLTNDGPSAASGVTVSDTLPGGFAYQDSLPAAGTYDKDTGVWTVGSLNKDAATTLVITATVNAGGSYTNSVEVASAGERDLDSTPANSSTTEDDDDTFVVTPVPVADLHLEKTGAPARQQVGQNVVFTLTLTNDGPSAASSVTVTDLLPSGFTYVGAAAAAGAYDKDTGLWTVGSLDKDAGISLVITATVNASGTYTNYAQVAHSGELDPDSTPANGSTTEDDDGEFVVTPTAVADLSLIKTGNPAVQYVGQNVVFTLTLANGGPSTASSVAVSDTLPSGFAYAGSLASAGSYDYLSGLWTVGDMSAGANAALVVTATLNATGSYTNYAEVAASDQIDNDSIPANNSTTEDDDGQFAVTPVALVDLSLAKTGYPAVQYVGQNVVFTLTLANDGPSAASGIVVSDVLPSGFTYVGSLPSAGTYTDGNGAWVVDSLNAGANAGLVLTATVNAAGTYTNYAEIAAVAQVDRDSLPGNHSTTEDDDDSFVVTPVPVVDLSLAKSGAPLVPIIGRSIVFSITVTNGGPSRATDIAVRDPLLSGYTFVATQASAGSYSAGLWALGSLDAGAAATLQISATVNMSGTYVNYAEIAGCGQIDVDSTPGNNSTTEDDDDSIIPVPVRTATIGNYVWLDANQDGVQGAGEGGVAGVMVQLFRADNTPVASKLTDGAGKYEFSGLQPGDYYLQFTLPSGYVATLLDAPAALGDTADSDGGADGKTPVTNLASGENDLTWDFGLVLPAAPAAIGDTVWLDTDMDGLQDAGESGVPGVSVQLFTAGNTPVAAVATDAAGHYLFSNLSAGDYYLLFTPPAGYAVSPKDASAQAGNDALTGGTLDSDVGADGKTPVTSLVAGETDSTWDLGLYLPAQPGTLGGSVWLDTVQDGLQGAAESGVPGAPVQLYRADNTLVAGTLTDAAGGYQFANLPSGDYYVQIVPPVGYLITTQDAAGEAGSDPSTGGSSDSDAGADGTMPVTSLAAGETDLTWDGGIYLPTPPASIGGYVWFDANRDGIQDAGETGVASVAVELLNQAGRLLTTERTDAGGRYRFGNLLSGAYYLHFVLPPGYAISPLDAAGSDAAGDTVDSDADQVAGLTVPFSLSAGEQSLHWSMGLVLPAAPASLGDRVWLDTNGDGVQDITEQGVPAVTVHLLDAGAAVVKSTVTGDSGKYTFDNLPAGTYALQFVPPPGYIVTKSDVLADFADSDADPGTGRTVTFTLASGQRNPTLDAGLYLPEPPVSIGHLVWYDSDQDGVQDAGETGVPGVPVMIYRVDETFVGAAITDNTGSYRFDRLPAGDYYIRFVPPSLYTISPQDTGTDDALDSDVNPVTGKTAAITFNPGVVDLNRDMGLYLPTQPSVFSGETWIDTNNNGIQEAGEPPVADVVVRLFDASEQPTADGTLLAETKTGAEGRYEFDNLAQGAYYLAFVPKPGYATALADIGSDSLDSDANTVTGRTAVYVLAAGERADSVSAGYVPLLSVGDLVFNDFRNNGIYEPVEDDGVDGVKVNIYHDADADGVLSAADGDPVASTITDNGGRYLFTGLTPGDYVVELDDSNFAEGGLIRMFASSLSSRNAAAEPIMDPDNDVDGDDNGYDSHAPDGGVDIVSRAISLAFDAEPITDGDLNPSSNLSLDFGIYDPTVGNRVWLDRDMDGVQDDGEPGIAGVVMNIYLDSNTNGVLDEHDRYLRSLTTNADGVYLFTFLAPGDYVIQVAAVNFEPGGMLVGWHPAAGGSDPDDDVNTDSNGIADAYGGVSALAITLTSGGEPINDGDTDEFTNLTVDFGFWPDPSALGDYVWWDYNKDGIQDVGELPVAGVTVTLYSTTAGIGAPPLAQTKTDQQGKYLFASLVPGFYYIQFILPPQYGITRFQAGSSRSADSDVNTDGKTPVMNVRAGTDDRDCDLGLIYPTAENEVPEPGSADNLFLPMVSN